MKFTRKNNDKTKYKNNGKIKTKRKNNNKKKIGGENTKISFAYTYLIINYADYIKYIYNESLANNFILEKQTHCSCIETGNTANCNTYIKNTPILKNENEHLILVMKYRNMVVFFENLKNNKNLFGEIYFLNEILGSAIIRKYSYNNIVKIGIYNVCLYLNEKQGKGYGSVIFNIILQAIGGLYSFPNQNENAMTILWLGIRLDNPNFKKLAYLYTSFGFKNPKVITNDLNGNNLDFKIMEFYKVIDEYVTDEDTTKKIFVEAIDIYNQSIIQSKLCKFKFTLDKSAILNLRLMPYLNTMGKFETILNDNKTNNEYSGSLFIYNAYYDEISEDVYYKLSLETIENNKGISYVIGENENVYVKDDQRTFHTHPILAYVNWNRLVGFPSGADFSVVFQKGFNRNIQFQFHMVITIEGIYILSLSEKIVNAYNEISIDFIENIVNWTLNNKSLLQYNPDLSYNWKNVNVDNYAKDVSIEVNKFLVWFKNYTNGGFRLNDYIECQFHPWKNIDKNTKFEVFYHNFDNQCYPSKLL